MNHILIGSTLVIKSSQTFMTIQTISSASFFSIHDDVIKWKHFPRNWSFVRGIHRSPVNSPHKGQWRGALFFFICVWINDWVNNREAGDLRRYRAHYDVIVMYLRPQIRQTPTHDFKTRIITSSFSFEETIPESVTLIINDFLSKFNSDHDGPSMNLIKSIKEDLSRPLFLIINPSSCIRIFHVRLKVAKITLQFKKGDESIVDNTQHMMTSSNGNIFRVTGPLCGEFTGPRWIPTQRPVTRSFDAFFDLRRNKSLSKQSWGWWSETPSSSLWRHRNAVSVLPGIVENIKKMPLFNLMIISAETYCYIVANTIPLT